MPPEKLEMITKKTAPTNPDNSLPESVLEIQDQITSGKLILVEATRQIWRMFHAGELTMDQRMEAMEFILGSLDSDVKEDLERQLPQIRAEMETEFKQKNRPKRPSGGWRKHIRRQKAEARRGTN